MKFMTKPFEHPYVDAKPPPWWVRRIKFLRLLWFNPLFQRNYQRGRLKPLIRPRYAFWIGLVVGALMSINVGGVGFIGPFWQFISIPVALLILFEFGRYFIACLVHTSRMIKQEIDVDRVSPILATPMSDRDIFNAMCLPNLVRSFEASQVLIMFGLGIVIPSIVTGLAQNFIGFGIYPSFVLVYGGVTILTYLLYFVTPLILVSYATGLFSVSNQISGAILGALLFTSTFTLLPVFGWWGFLWAVGAASPAGGCGTGMMMFFIPFIPPYNLIGVVPILIGISIARALGYTVFSRTRRGGFYRPEGLTASELEY